MSYEPPIDASTQKLGLRLLQAVIENDARMVEGLLEHTHANFTYDTIPLLAVAATNNASLNIVRLLVDHGANPRLSANYGRAMGVLPHRLSSDPSVTQYLEQAHRTEAGHQDDLGLSKKEAVDIPLGQFAYQYECFLLKHIEAYTNETYTEEMQRMDEGRDNTLPCYIEPDRIPCLLDRQTLLQKVDKERQLAYKKAFENNLEKPNCTIQSGIPLLKPFIYS